jgi:hypothetical protein
MTMRRFVLTLFLAASSAGLLAQRSGPPAVRTPAKDAAVPFRVGETLTYDVAWSSFLVAGTAVTTVQETRPVGSSTAYYIVVEGGPIPILRRLYNLYYKMDTLLDSRTLLSHRGSLYAEEGGARRTAITRVDHGSRRAFFELDKGGRTELDYPVPSQTYDGLGAFFALRARPIRTGDQLTIPVADSGELFNVGVTVGAPERVRVPAGQYDAARMAVTIRDQQGADVWKNIVVWVTTGERRLPVKLQAELPIGEFVLALRDAR